MELIYVKKDITKQKIDTGYLRNYSADISVCIDDSDNNDFEIKTSLPSRENLLWIENEIETTIYAEGFEYGGKITGCLIDVSANEITYTGNTWRGTLKDYIIEPPHGEDYYIAKSGTNLKELFTSLPHDPVLEFQECEYNLKNDLQFDRYITTEEGIAKALAAAGNDLRMRIEYSVEAPNPLGVAKCYIEPVRDLTDEIALSQDYGTGIKLKITRDYATPRHVICLGEGELKDRQVMHLYADENWNITKDEIQGATPTVIYDASSSKTLEHDGIKHFQELINSHEKIDINISDIGVETGDIIGAKDNITGEVVTSRVTGIIWKREDFGAYATESWEYRTKERSFI